MQMLKRDSLRLGDGGGRRRVGICVMSDEGVLLICTLI